MSEIILLGSGRMSTFGGPDDMGVGADEGLALVEASDLAEWWFAYLFLRMQPPGTMGLARRLNPQAFYIAMRWDYTQFPKSLLRNTVVCVTNPKTGASIFARPVDYGPGDGTIIDGRPTPNTGRIADLSPGAAAVLGVETDDVVGCELVG